MKNFSTLFFSSICLLVGIQCSPEKSITETCGLQYAEHACEYVAAHDLLYVCSNSESYAKACSLVDSVCFNNESICLYYYYINSLVTGRIIANRRTGRFYNIDSDDINKGIPCTSQLSDTPDIFLIKNIINDENIKFNNQDELFHFLIIAILDNPVVTREYNPNILSDYISSQMWSDLAVWPRKGEKKPCVDSLLQQMQNQISRYARREAELINLGFETRFFGEGGAMCLLWADPKDLQAFGIDYFYPM